MEWSKIKNILIIALLLTNLLFIYMIVMPDFQNSFSEDSDLIADTLKVLERNGITVSANLPGNQRSLPVITLTYDSDNGSYSYDPLEKSQASKQTIDEESAEKIADDFVKNLKLKSSSDKKLCSVYLSDEFESIYTVTYGGYYEDFRIEDSYIILQVSSDGVISMTKNWVTAESSGKNAKKIVSVSNALLKYMNLVKKARPDASVEVTEVSLVYKTDSVYNGNITSDTAFPSWKITDSDGNTEYISAYQQ